jgi:gas vesicle structural protein
MALQPADTGGGGGGVVEHEGGASSLADVLNTILDKGLVIDVFARVSLVGIELLRVDARIVVASVDTYLRFAESANRLGVGATEPAGLPGLVGDIQAANSKDEALELVEGKVDEIFGTGDEQEAEEEPAEKKEKS